MVAETQFAVAGRRVCAWCNRDLGEAERLEAGKVTHGICPRCAAELVAQAVAADALAEAVKPPAPVPLVFLEVRRHPSGGWTHAERVDATRHTTRIYRGWWRTKRAAEQALEERFRA